MNSYFKGLSPFAVGAALLLGSGLYAYGEAQTVSTDPNTTLAPSTDRHAGYYYPEAQTSEIYNTPIRALPRSNRRMRIGFTVGLNAKQLKRAYPPQYHIYAKGSTGEKMIIVASGEGRYDTLFRLRALLAALSSEARTSALFQKARNPENLNFLDLAKMTGFTQITLSDGDKMAHRIELR